MFEVLFFAGLFFAIGPPVLACRAVFRFPEMVKLVGAVLATWQQIVIGIPACLILAALVDAPRLPGPKAMGGNGIVLIWFVVVIIYGVLSLRLWLRYGLECQNAQGRYPERDWQMNADQ
jgi:hypothetical protein